MFVLNRMKDDIGPVTHEGFVYIIPANSVSAIFTPAGEYFLSHNFPPANPKEPLNTGIPPLLPAEEKDWDGSSYAMVSRFKIDATRIPDRGYLLILAEKYGMDNNKLSELRSNNEITNEMVVATINKLPVPENIRIPERKKLKKE